MPVDIIGVDLSTPSVNDHGPVEAGKEVDVVEGNEDENYGEVDTIPSDGLHVPDNGRWRFVEEVEPKHYHSLRRGGVGC